MLELEFNKQTLATVFSSDQIQKSFNEAIKKHNKQIFGFVFDFYNHIRLHSTHLVPELNISTETIEAIYINSIQQNIINSAFSMAFTKKQYNIKKMLLEVLGNDEIMEELCTNTKDFESGFYLFIRSNIGANCSNSQKLIYELENIPNF